MNNFDPPLPNLEKEYAKIGLYILPIGLVLMLVGLYLSMQGDSIFLIGMGLFICIVGLMVWIGLLARAKAINELIDGKELIATWTYNEQLWSAYLTLEKYINRKQKKILLYITGGLASFGALAFIFAYFIVLNDTVLLTFSAITGVSLFFWFILRLVFAIPDPREFSKQGRILFGQNCLYIEGYFLEWRSYGVRLESVEHDEMEELLIFRIYHKKTKSSSSSIHFRMQEILLPIPPYEKESLAVILAAFKDKIK